LKPHLPATQTKGKETLNDYSQQNVVTSFKYLNFLRKNPWMKKLKKNLKKVTREKKINGPKV
jgi:hypothetical protein